MNVCKTVHRLNTNGRSLMVNKQCARPNDCTIQHVGCKSIFYLTDTLVRIYSEPLFANEWRIEGGAGVQAAPGGK